MAPRQRVLVIGLDGLEVTFAERLMAAGEMSALGALRRRAACFRLDHGPAQNTGLAWEHFASGLSPDDGRRWAAVEFDPSAYFAWQEGARFTPWWTGLDRRVAVFDTPYVDLRRAVDTRGVVGWGAHDPGTPTAGRPHELLAEFEGRFGPYPAAPWTYGRPFPSTIRTQKMGEALSQALDIRARAARWLATERLADWDLFIAVAGEIHGAVEGLWHGVHPSHPLHGHASAAVAARALLQVHRGLDRMVADLMAADENAAVVAFNMGGMGCNYSDVPSMILLPELLYRNAFGQPLLNVQPEWAASPGSVPIVDEEDNSSATAEVLVPMAAEPISRFSGALGSLGRRLPRRVKAIVKGIRSSRAERLSSAAATDRSDLDWQPAQRYRRHWPRMPAFALPSFYDGRIRINLRGRERHGTVAPSRYEEACRDLETMLRECRDPRTGEPVVDSIGRACTRDPLNLAGSEADLLVVWRGVVAAFEHPRLGLIGPVPLRRTGGHTGPHGFAYVVAPGLEPGERGVRSAFDVVPTIMELMGVTTSRHVSGKSLL